ncbi:MAG: hypothetical protein U9N36_04025, partial [Euryarchaeota archaeon]|nr:hypothetical protein [Euryarchaeota archaeon]
MKYIHITHNRSIVNATDDTSDTLIRARTLAPPVCTAADSPTADSGRGMMSARRSNQGRWCSVAILIAFAATLFVCGTASAATQTIDGDPVDVSVYGGGRIVPYYDNWANKYQYFGTTACNNVLWLNGTSMGFDAPNGSNCGAPLFTPVSNSKPDPWTIETVYDAGDTGVRITQRIEYINGNRYYTMNWSIANNGAPTYSDLRFIHGGDTYFGGQDSANGNYDSGLNMVYLTNSGVTGIMGLLGTPTSPMDHHQAGQYGTVTSSMCAGRLSDIVDPSFTDAGYAAEWDQATLAPGDVWEIVAIEKWTAAGDVQVFSPAGQSGYVGDTFDYSFTVQNLQSSSDTFDLSTSSSQGWAVSLPGGGTVTIGASSSETVLVQVAVTSEGTDVTTLTVTSQSDSSVTNDDSVTTQAATSHLCTCGDICVNQDCWWHDGGSFNQSTTPIQHAINNSTAGNTIYVAGGDYTENVNVNKQVTLRGEGADVVNVTAESAGDHVFDVQQDYVNISGFNVT